MNFSSVDKLIMIFAIVEQPKCAVNTVCQVLLSHFAIHLISFKIVGVGSPEGKLAVMTGPRF